MKYSLILGLMIAAMFIIPLADADALIGSAKRLVYNVDLGQIQSQTWTLTNNEKVPIKLEIYATGKGSNLLQYETILYLEPATSRILEVFVDIPDDHPDNIEFHPDLFAIKRGISEGGSTGMVVNVQMKTTPFIKIGDNPIYTPPIVDTPKPKEVPQINEEVIEESVEETMEERLAKIKSANEANNKDIPVEETPSNNDEVFKSGFVEEPVADFVEEPVADPVVIVTECGLLEIILSWFGIGKC